MATEIRFFSKKVPERIAGTYVTLSARYLLYCAAPVGMDR